MGQASHVFQREKCPLHWKNYLHIESEFILFILFANSIKLYHFNLSKYTLYIGKWLGDYTENEYLHEIRPNHFVHLFINEILINII